MAKDELDRLGLSDDERELIDRLRKEKRESDEREVWVKTSDGHEARLPFAAAQKWLSKIGVLLAEDDPGEEVKEPEEPEEPEKDKPVRFAGRRVS